MIKTGLTLILLSAGIVQPVGAAAPQPSRLDTERAQAIPELLLSVTAEDQAKVLRQTNFRLRETLWFSKRARVVRINVDALASADLVSITLFPGDKVGAAAPIIVRRKEFKDVGGGLAVWRGVIQGPNGDRFKKRDQRTGQLVEDDFAGLIQLSVTRFGQSMTASEAQVERRRNQTGRMLGVVKNPDELKAGAEPIVSVALSIVAGTFHLFAQGGVSGSMLQGPEMVLTSNSDDPRFHITYEVDPSNHIPVGDDTPGLPRAERVVPGGKGASAAQRYVDFRATLREEERLYRLQQANQDKGIRK
jgi:hypothetical protein